MEGEQVVLALPIHEGQDGRQVLGVEAKVDQLVHQQELVVLQGGHHARPLHPEVLDAEVQRQEDRQGKQHRLYDVSDRGSHPGALSSVV